LGESTIRCHCGNVMIVRTSYNGQTGWCECYCGCAWSYEDEGGGHIRLRKERDCKEPSNEEVKIFKHYPESLVGGV